MTLRDFNPSLMRALVERRSKRFPVGGALRARRGGLAHESSEKPYPLSEEETALLCFAAAGTTGVTTEEIRHLMGHLTCTGRTAGSPCASMTMHLFYTDDEGLFYYKSPTLCPSDRAIRLCSGGSVSLQAIVQDFHDHRIKLQDGRLDVPREAIGAAFESFVNLPGTTMFIPLADTTREYINLLMTGVAQFRWQLWDEVTHTPAGVDRWVENGFLNGPRITIHQYDQMLPWLCSLEAGMAMQNCALMVSALGIGCFPMHTIDLPTVMRCMGMRFAQPSVAYPQASPNPVGIPGVLEGTCPPNHSVDEAVDAVAELKWGEGGLYGPDGYNLSRPKLYDDVVEVSREFCRYVYNTYGRLPKYADAMFIPLLFQAHHIDLEFYERHLPDHVTEAERDHRRIWHAGEGGGV
ncbi:hypothetical protein H5T55_07325 [Candidatus Bipolaricaulota bacterium]|nr:hypothetical protein [Candidatus Bipolaricaulota bacterium]